MLTVGAHQRNKYDNGGRHAVLPVLKFVYSHIELQPGCHSNAKGSFELIKICCQFEEFQLCATLEIFGSISSRTHVVFSFK